jgi:hypothetical protein
MNIQVHHVIVHTPEQVREIVAEAVKIAEATESELVPAVYVFEQACTLLGARFSMAVNQQPVPMDLGALGANHMRKGW